MGKAIGIGILFVVVYVHSATVRSWLAPHIEDAAKARAAFVREFQGGASR